MNQKLFKECGLLQLTDGNKSRLFKVPRNLSAKPLEHAETFEIEVLPFLSEPQSVLNVYPDANLIITQDAIMTLNGKIILQHERDTVTVVPVAEKHEWLIIRDTFQDNDTRYRLTFWDGEKECGGICGNILLKSAKYLALYTAHNRCWQVFTSDGNPVFTLEDADTTVRLCGDFLVSEGIGCHSAYILKPEENTDTIGLCVFKQQQLILCSKYQSFALCANMQGAVNSYYNSFYHIHGKAEMIELYDRAGLFSIKRNGRFFLYRFNGESYATNIYPCGADSVAYNQEDDTLLIGVNGIFRIHSCA